MSSRPPYKGSRRKLVMAFDVGTTFSGISYRYLGRLLTLFSFILCSTCSILDPGQVPEVKGVTRFPAQEHSSGSSKIPTVVYYDKQGTVRAIGAEAASEGIFEQAEDGDWYKVEWFKLHLRPNTKQTAHISEQLPPLPPQKKIIDVFADFFKYLFQCAASYIQETHANGRTLWNSLEDDIHFVLSHPNGWEGPQQSQMRQAAVIAGLIPDNTRGRSRVSFVTEGEASLHFSIENGLPADAMETGEGVVIVDAGGGTLDISAYSKSTNGAKDSFEEISAPQCHFHGSIFVSIHARQFLEDHLSDSAFIDDIDNMVRCFDRTTKLRFRNVNEPQFIKFGSTRDNEPESDIRYGQLKLTGCIVQAVNEQQRTAHRAFSVLQFFAVLQAHIVLVGGFSSNDWLYQRVKEDLQPLGYNVIRPVNHLNKAVADGAISFYIDHYVHTRVSKFDYGQFSNVRYDPQNSEHEARYKDSYVSLSGQRNIKNSFSVILPKVNPGMIYCAFFFSNFGRQNTQVSETKEFSRKFHLSRPTSSGLKSAPAMLWSYRGEITNPRWKDVDKG
ncbi:uncharacterized protein LACBIDRAFT_327574 [Laccaria bicolor S238N-H82]|uniref:Predicted protein n=1 Tax=Laccaria bicolor (strain S238N-H82 / ATCC MYA-4686) TaxID=486041 RepID=B0DC59_LACBS|nr:uncharacterized protein LACBIDRAFT_327574 [Laccaria bicolor S238N-H82]EDR07836.1 predicted protein [Laccaria bicolor S238N-H82]|eukprot:XP_001881625.1 predicted protein [Laccaria bicolor S238N-H82]